MKLPTKAIEATDHLDCPLWCVYGSSIYWPQILCCKVKGEIAPVIWGYSVWEREPGFRTLGVLLRPWVKSHKVCAFFADQQHALDYIKKITTPKAGR